MKTNDLKIQIAFWLERPMSHLPESWSRPIRWIAWKFAGHDSGGVSPLPVFTDNVETYIPTAQQVLILRFVRLKLDMSNEEIGSMLRDQGLEPAKPEHMDVLAQNPERCPDGRLVAVGGDGERVRVFWVKKSTQTLNMFWFPREISQISGDFAVGIVP